MFTSQCRRCQVCLNLLFWRRRLQKQCVLLTTSSSPRPFYFGTPAHTRVAEKTFRLPEAATACQSSPVHIFSFFPPVSVPSRQTDTQTDRKARCHQFRNTVSLLDSRDAIAPGLHGERQQRAGTQFFVRGENVTLHLISSPFQLHQTETVKAPGQCWGRRGRTNKQTEPKKKKKN